MYRSCRCLIRMGSRLRDKKSHTLRKCPKSALSFVLTEFRFSELLKKGIAFLRLTSSGGIVMLSAKMWIYEHRGWLCAPLNMAECTREVGVFLYFNLTNGVYCMKKIVAGIGFEITGMFMVLCFAVVTGLNIQNTTSWYTSIGQYWQTAINMGMIPICIIGFVLLTAGIVFSLWGIFSKSDQ